MEQRVPLFEAIASSLEDARTIEAAGGQRIELVSALSQGGLTPSLGLVQAVLDQVSLPVAVMVRPNKQGFCYSPDDLEEMGRDARIFWAMGVRHIVTGLLDEEGLADIQGLERLLRGTGFQVTFHRAIDETTDIGRSLERINACPRISHILTSLGQGQVIDNLDRLAWYREKARPRLILASGITHKNAGILAAAARVHGTDIHVGTALRQGKAMRPVDPDLTRTMADILGGGRGLTRPWGHGLAEQAFRQARYGLFIHFGLYSLLGGSYQGVETPFLAEWIRLTLAIPDADYRELAKSFDPVDFDADQVCRQAKAWGMGYVCLTAKHHDGFALFDSKADRFNSVAQSPGGRDFVGELARACQKHGLLFCLYYSQAQDWDHPGGMRAYREPPSREAFEGYFRNKCLPQIRELLTGYGPLAMLWLDTPMAMTAGDCQAIRDLVRQLQPTCLLSGRIGQGLGDYTTTSDNRMPRLAQTRLWEMPVSLNDSWGYKAGDKNWKSHKDLIRLMTQAASRGGNLLINLGPDGRGSIPPASRSVLDKAGHFLTLYQEAYQGARPCPPYPYEGGAFLLTSTPGHLFIHLTAYPEGGGLELFHIESQALQFSLMANHPPLEAQVTQDLEGHPYWRLNLEGQEKLIRDEIESWGEAIIQVQLQETWVKIGGI